MKKKNKDNTQFITDKVKEQIIAIRDSGETNMFDTKKVLEIANRDEYSELVTLIEENKIAYLNFILNGGTSNE